MPCKRGQKFEVEGFDTVAGPVVVRIAQVGGVRDHKRGIAEIPERCMIAAARIRQRAAAPGYGQPLAGEIAGRTPAIIPVAMQAQNEGARATPQSPPRIDCLIGEKTRRSWMDRMR